MFHIAIALKPLILKHFVFKIRCLNVAMPPKLLFLQGDSVNLPQEENTPKKRVEKIFKLMDQVHALLVCVLCTIDPQ